MSTTGSFGRPAKCGRAHRHSAPCASWMFRWGTAGRRERGAAGQRAGQEPGSGRCCRSAWRSRGLPRRRTTSCPPRCARTAALRSTPGGCPWHRAALPVARSLRPRAGSEGEHARPKCLRISPGKPATPPDAMAMSCAVRILGAGSRRHARRALAGRAMHRCACRPAFGARPHSRHTSGTSQRDGPPAPTRPLFSKPFGGTSRPMDRRSAWGTVRPSQQAMRACALCVLGRVSRAVGVGGVVSVISWSEASREDSRLHCFRRPL